MARPPVARFSLLGPPQSGKTTLFCAWTGIDYEKAVASPRPLSAPARVVDPRLQKLHAREEPQSELTFLTVEIVDTPPIGWEQQTRGGNTEALARARETDGLIFVVRGDGTGVPPEWEQIRSELHRNDLEILKGRAERLRVDAKKPGPKHQIEEVQRELETVERLIERISAGEQRALEGVTPEEEKRIRGFMLFALKPSVLVVHLPDSAAATGRVGSEVSALALSLEFELLRTPEADRREFLDMYSMQEPMLPKLLPQVYRSLGYLSFFTPSEKETASWGIQAGRPATEAAGKIHKDIQKGLIACDVVSWSDWESLGSIREAKARGRCRVEGKDYVLNDGDIIFFKHS